MLVRMFSIHRSSGESGRTSSKLDDVQGIVSIFAYFDDTESLNKSSPVDVYVEKESETIGILRKTSLGNALKASEKSVKFNESNMLYPTSSSGNSSSHHGPIVEALVHNYKVSKTSRLHDLLAILLPRWQALTEKVLTFLSSHQSDIYGRTSYPYSNYHNQASSGLQHSSQQGDNNNNSSSNSSNNNNASSNNNNNTGGNNNNNYNGNSESNAGEENSEQRSKFKEILLVALEFAKQIGMSPNYEQGSSKSDNEIAFFLLDDATSSFDGHGNEDYWRMFSTFGIPIHTIRIASSLDIYEDDLKYIQDPSTLEFISMRTNGVHLVGRDIVELYSNENEFFLFQTSLANSLSVIKSRISERKKRKEKSILKYGVVSNQQYRTSEIIFPWDYRSHSQKQRENDMIDVEYPSSRPQDIAGITLADYRFICPINELIQRRLNDGFVIKEKFIQRGENTDRCSIGYKVSLQWSLAVTIDYFARSKAVFPRDNGNYSENSKDLFNGLESSSIEHTNIQIRISAPVHFLQGFLLVQQRSKDQIVEKFERATFLQISLHEYILSLIASDKVYSHMMIKSPIIPHRKSHPTVGTGLVLQSLPLQEWSRYINKFKDIEIVVSNTRSLVFIQRCLQEWSSSTIPGKLFIWESNNMKFSCIAGVAWALSPHILTIRIAYARSSIEDDKNVSNIEFSHNNDFNSAIEDLCNKLALDNDVAYIFKARPIFPLISEGLLSQSILSNRSYWPLSYYGISSLTFKSALRMILKARSREGFFLLMNTNDKGTQNSNSSASMPISGLHHGPQTSYSQQWTFILVLNAEPKIRTNFSRDEVTYVQNADVFDNSFIIEKVRVGDLSTSMVVRYNLKSILLQAAQQNAGTGDFANPVSILSPSGDISTSSTSSQVGKNQSIQPKDHSGSSSTSILRRGSSNIAATTGAGNKAKDDQSLSNGVFAECELAIEEKTSHSLFIQKLSHYIRDIDNCCILASTLFGFIHESKVLGVPTQISKTIRGIHHLLSHAQRFTIPIKFPGNHENCNEILSMLRKSLRELSDCVVVPSGSISSLSALNITSDTPEFERETAEEYYLKGDSATNYLDSEHLVSGKAIIVAIPLNGDSLFASGEIECFELDASDIYHFDKFQPKPSHPVEVDVRNSLFTNGLDGQDSDDLDIPHHQSWASEFIYMIVRAHEHNLAKRVFQSVVNKESVSGSEMKYLYNVCSKIETEEIDMTLVQTELLLRCFSQNENLSNANKMDKITKSNFASQLDAKFKKVMQDLCLVQPYVSSTHSDDTEFQILKESNDEGSNKSIYYYDETMSIISNLLDIRSPVGRGSEPMLPILVEVSCVIAPRDHLASDASSPASTASSKVSEYGLSQALITLIDTEKLDINVVKEERFRIPIPSLFSPSIPASLGSDIDKSLSMLRGANQQGNEIVSNISSPWDNSNVSSFPRINLQISAYTLQEDRHVRGKISDILNELKRNISTFIASNVLEMLLEENLTVERKLISLVSKLMNFGDFTMNEYQIFSVPISQNLYSTKMIIPTLPGRDPRNSMGNYGLEIKPGHRQINDTGDINSTDTESEYIRHVKRLVIQQLIQGTADQSFPSKFINQNLQNLQFRRVGEMIVITYRDSPIAPFWAILDILRDEILIRIHSAKQSIEILANSIAELITIAFRRVDRILHLQNLHETRIASNLLIPNPESSSSTASSPGSSINIDDSSSSKGILSRTPTPPQLGPSGGRKRVTLHNEIQYEEPDPDILSRVLFACPRYRRFVFPLVERMTSSITIKLLSQDMSLSPFLVSNRPNTFVSIDSSRNVFYFCIEPAIIVPEAEKNIPDDMGNNSSNEPDTTKLNQSFSGRVIDNSNAEHHGIVLDIYGNTPANPESLEQLYQMISTKISLYTVDFLCSFVERHPNMKLSNSDITFLQQDRHSTYSIVLKNEFLQSLTSSLNIMDEMLSSLKGSILPSYFLEIQVSANASNNQRQSGLAAATATSSASNPASRRYFLYQQRENHHQAPSSSTSSSPGSEVIGVALIDFSIQSCETHEENSSIRTDSFPEWIRHGAPITFSSSEYSQSTLTNSLRIEFECWTRGNVETNTIENNLLRVVKHMLCERYLDDKLHSSISVSEKSKIYKDLELFLDVIEFSTKETMKNINSKTSSNTNLAFFFFSPAYINFTGVHYKFSSWALKYFYEDFNQSLQQNHQITLLPGKFGRDMNSESLWVSVVDNGNDNQHLSQKDLVGGSSSKAIQSPPTPHGENDNKLHRKGIICLRIKGESPLLYAYHVSPRLVASIKDVFIKCYSWTIRQLIILNDMLLQKIGKYTYRMMFWERSVTRYLLNISNLYQNEHQPNHKDSLSLKVSKSKSSRVGGNASASNSIPGISPYKNPAPAAAASSSSSSGTQIQKLQEYKEAIVAESSPAILHKTSAILNVSTVQPPAARTIPSSNSDLPLRQYMMWRMPMERPSAQPQMLGINSASSRSTQAISSRSLLDYNINLFHGMHELPVIILDQSLISFRDLENLFKMNPSLKGDPFRIHGLQILKMIEKYQIHIGNESELIAYLLEFERKSHVHPSNYLSPINTPKVTPSTSPTGPKLREGLIVGEISSENYTPEKKMPIPSSKSTNTLQNIENAGLSSSSTSHVTKDRIESKQINQILTLSRLVHSLRWRLNIQYNEESLSKVQSCVVMCMSQDVGLFKLDVIDGNNEVYMAKLIGNDDEAKKNLLICKVKVYKEKARNNTIVCSDFFIVESMNLKKHQYLLNNLTILQTRQSGSQLNKYRKRYSSSGESDHFSIECSSLMSAAIFNVGVTIYDFEIIYLRDKLIHNQESDSAERLLQVSRSESQSASVTIRNGLIHAKSFLHEKKLYVLLSFLRDNPNVMRQDRSTAEGDLHLFGYKSDTVRVDDSFSDDDSEDDKQTNSEKFILVYQKGYQTVTLFSDCTFFTVYDGRHLSSEEYFIIEGQEEEEDEGMGMMDDGRVEGINKLSDNSLEEASSWIRSYLLRVNSAHEIYLAWNELVIKKRMITDPDLLLSSLQTIKLVEFEKDLLQLTQLVSRSFVQENENDFFDYLKRLYGDNMIKVDDEDAFSISEGRKESHVFIILNPKAIISVKWFDFDICFPTFIKWDEEEVERSAMHIHITAFIQSIVSYVVEKC